MLRSGEATVRSLAVTCEVIAALSKTPERSNPIPVLGHGQEGDHRAGGSVIDGLRTAWDWAVAG